MSRDRALHWSSGSPMGSVGVNLPCLGGHGSEPVRAGVFPLGGAGMVLGRLILFLFWLLQLP